MNEERIAFLRKELTMGHPDKEILVRKSEAQALGLFFYTEGKFLEKADGYEAARRHRALQQPYAAKPTLPARVYVRMRDYLNALLKAENKNERTKTDGGERELLVESDDRGHPISEADPRIGPGGTVGGRVGSEDSD